MNKSIFQRSALASGLLTQEELDEAIALLEKDSSGEVTDERLAECLVDQGRINRWQAAKLREGHTAFTLGPYHIIDCLGKGGMGEVFKGEHSFMGRVVAVKVLPLHKSTPQSIASFTREIRMQAQLDHHNLVRAYDAGHERNVHYLVTEYVPGTDLRRLIRGQGRLSMQAAADIVTQAAQGLAYAHDRGLIHRDLKPGNLLVTPDGHTKVSDLGLAGYFDEAEQTDIHGGKVVGTADYLAPEQINAPERLGPVSDIYSLGCTLYYAVTGKVPFPGGTARDKARAHCQLPPLDPRRLNPELSSEFVDVIADMMAKDPDQRIQTANEVIARLAPWVQGTARPPIPQMERAALQSLERPAPPRSIAPGLDDTEPNFLLPPGEELWPGESPSQLSLGTHPIASGSQDTFPAFFRDRDSHAWHDLMAGTSPLFKLLILVGMVMALGTLAAVIFGMAYTAFGG